MKYTLIIFIINLTVNMTSFSQDITRHKWKDRLILIFAEDSSDSAVDRQLKELINAEDGLLDRKIVVYNVLPDKYYKVFPEKESIVKSGDLFDMYKVTDAPFEIILIGLDGGVKLRETELLTAEKLFVVIDGMPMRRREIESRQNK